MSPMAARTRRWAALGATLATMLAASVAFGEAPTPGEVAYLTSGPTVHQPTFAFEGDGEHQTDIMRESE
jgi:hypothetical protein